MKTSPGRRRIRLVAAALIAAGVFVSPTPVPAQGGLVRIFNRTPAPVVIYVQNVDFYGYRRWDNIGTIPPRGAQDFPGVPPGAVFGAQSLDGSRQWPRFMVTYPPGAPVFQYTLFP